MKYLFFFFLSFWFFCFFGSSICFNWKQLFYLVCGAYAQKVMETSSLSSRSGKQAIVFFEVWALPSLEENSDFDTLIDDNFHTILFFFHFELIVDSEITKKILQRGFMDLSSNIHNITTGKWHWCNNKTISTIRNLERQLDAHILLFTIPYCRIPIWGNHTKRYRICLFVSGQIPNTAKDGILGKKKKPGY